jgi:hypothetical protein
MQFGLFSVGDITTNPTTGETPTEHERLMNLMTIAEHADQAGLFSRTYQKYYPININHPYNHTRPCTPS